MILYLYQYYGVSIYFGESIEKISDNIKGGETKCYYRCTKTFRKVYDKIYAKGTELTGIKKPYFLGNRACAMSHMVLMDFGIIQLKLHENLFSVNGKRFGKSKLMVSGSAALQTRLARILLQQKSP
jgi:long-chain acyl-CoA synthetase